MKASLIDKTAKGAAVGAALLATVFVKPALAQRALQSVELNRLISMFMFPTGVNYNVLDWSTGSAPGTPISWQHAGIRDCDRFALGTDLERPFCRTGSVAVTVGGKPTHTILGRVLEPGKWRITLGGSRAGVDYVIIDADVTSQELDNRVLVTAANKVKSGIRLRQISTCGSGSSGTAAYRINAPGKEVAVIREWWSCGSAGCNVTLTLGLERDSTGELTRCSS